MALTCKKEQIILQGMNENISIGTTKSGKPRIIENSSSDDNMYLMLSSKGGYTRRGNGTIQVLVSQKHLFKILARGNGADGDAGGIGFWDCILMIAPSTGAIVKVRTSGGGYGTPTDLYIIYESKVYHCTIDTLEECCESLGIEIPCEITEERKFNGDEWVIL